VVVVPLWQFILKRLLIAIPTLVAVSIIGFLLMRFDVTVGPIQLPLPSGGVIQVLKQVHMKHPIDPLAGLRNNPQISPAALVAETQRLGLDQPMHVQYWRWVSHLFEVNPEAIRQGRPWAAWTPNLGQTFTGESVTHVLMSRAGNTLLLNVVSLLLTWAMALPLGVFAALRWRSLADRLMTVLTAVGMAMPSFVLALVLAVVVVQTNILPFGGLTSPDFDDMTLLAKGWDLAQHLILPVLIMTILGIAGLQRQMRGNLLEVLGAEYIRTARAKGLPERVVTYKHAVRTAINPMVTLMGYEFASLLSGSLLIEIVLGYPGLGALIYKAVLETDTNLVMASLIMSAGMLVLGNILADILLTWVDPRVELA
jgi:peptide/nickel transport system permease protein